MVNKMRLVNAVDKVNDTTCFLQVLLKQIISLCSQHNQIKFTLDNPSNFIQNLNDSFGTVFLIAFCYPSFRMPTQIKHRVHTKTSQLTRNISTYLENFLF
jgi:hypothetical protein